MSKKNNKTRKKKYVEMLKKIETENEEIAKRKMERKIIRNSANKLMEEIEDIGLDDEKKDKMDVEKRETQHQKKKKYRLKHGRY